MAWQLVEMGNEAEPCQLMLDDRFQSDIPGEELPTLSRLRFWCTKTPNGYYWHPDESADIEKIEDAVLRLADLHGDGWVVYVARRAVPGCLEYGFYSGGGVQLDGLLQDLEDAFPAYRFELEASADPEWSSYAGWFAEAAGSERNAAFTPAGREGLN